MRICSQLLLAQNGEGVGGEAGWGQVGGFIRYMQNLRIVIQHGQKYVDSMDVVGTPITNRHIKSNAFSLQ